MDFRVMNMNIPPLPQKQNKMKVLYGQVLLAINADIFFWKISLEISVPLPYRNSYIIKVNLTNLPPLPPKCKVEGTMTDIGLLYVCS